MNLGEKIREIRKSKKITQEQLADKIGVKRSVVSKYENNAVNISMETVNRIASALEVDIADLLSVPVKIVKVPENSEIMQTFKTEIKKAKELSDDLFISKYKSLSPVLKVTASNIIDELIEIDKLLKTDNRNDT